MRVARGLRRVADHDDALHRLRERPPGPGRLFISEKTVGTHVAHIFEKLGVHGRVEAAGRAHVLGVVERRA